MHSNKLNPHSLALGLPITHTGTNPPYSFVTLHPTPHAQRHDLYVAQPQCANIALNNTFVFTVRQHPSSLTRSPDPSTAINGRASPNPFARPASAMSMQSISASGSNYTNPSQSILEFLGQQLNEAGQTSRADAIRKDHSLDEEK
ncbi:hypothetical protein N0V90_008706 [Kalmusia sp. IMI 367209]|nr:hypothetical protein N0V90_008706 [Kalmusia sp. IMI 367209]